MGSLTKARRHAEGGIEPTEKAIWKKEAVCRRMAGYLQKFQLWCNLSD